MSQICTLFPQFYYHGEVEKHQELKDKLLSELTDDKLSQPKEWNCSVQSSFETENNFSWDYFYECIKPNLLDMHQQLKGNPLHQFTMTEAWLNKYGRGDSQEVHPHIGADNCTFSCS